MARPPAGFPWLPRESSAAGGLIAFCDPQGKEVLYVAKEDKVSTDRIVEIVVRATTLLSQIGSTAPAQAHREMVRIAGRYVAVLVGTVGICAGFYADFWL